MCLTLLSYPSPSAPQFHGHTIITPLPPRVTIKSWKKKNKMEWFLILHSSKYINKKLDNGITEDGKAER